MKRISFIVLFSIVAGISALGQSYIVDMARESVRSDKFTGGTIEKQQLVPGDTNIKITINVPAFQMTLWQSGREVKTYPIGVGLLGYPVKIGLMHASSVEWNPVWIPPSSDWIEKSSTVRPGEIILPTDPRNPLGKVKIPLGYGYLIHQAKASTDMGSLVSHGCIRVLQKDLYDLSEKIVAALSLPVTPAQIAAAKRNKTTLIAELDPVIPVEITYDTIVIENGRLNIYPDVYRHKRNTVENVRRELQTHGVDDAKLTDQQIKKMIAAAVGKRKYVIETAAIEKGSSPTAGRAVAVLSPSASKSSKTISY
jgi:hypothetical protein